MHHSTFEEYEIEGYSCIPVLIREEGSEPVLGDIKELQELRGNMNKISFKVIADYPNSDYKVGEILDIDDENGFNHHISHYPHLFKKITIEKNMITSEKLLKEIQDDAKECLRTLFVEPIPFDLDKWQTGKLDVQTRDGRKIEILKINARHKNYPIIGVALAITAEEYPESWGIKGNHSESGESELDLFLIPKTKVKYVNVYETEEVFDTKESAAEAVKAIEAYIENELKFVETKEVICNE